MAGSREIDVIADLMNVTSEQEVHERMRLFAREIGFEQALFGIEVRVPGQAPLQYITSGYPLEYQRLYAERGFILRDPTVAHAQTKRTPLEWTPSIYGPASFEIMEESRSHGLGDGISIPVHESDRVVSMLSLGRDRPFDSDAERRHVIRLGSLVATCLHVAMQNIVTEELLHQRRPRLTPRETHCLQLISVGKSTWDISQLLSISEAAVQFHAKNILRKFGVSTRVQAVAIAVALRML